MIPNKNHSDLEKEYKNLLSNYIGFELNADQQAALRSISNFLNDDSKSVFILQGCAGSGKTFLMQGVAKYLISMEKQVSLIAPTGKSAKVLTKKSGYEATTIHKHIYKFKGLEEVEEKKTSN